jgi:hypothetical protein
LARKEKLFSIADEMKNKKILFILIHIDEAHSSLWPVGLENQPEPQKDIDDRIKRATDFIENENVPFPVYIDTWNNNFAEIYHAWPDKYYCIDKNNNILLKSEYGDSGDSDAKIKVDCVDAILDLMEKI